MSTKRDRSDWSSVVAIAPGQEIALSTLKAKRSKRHLLRVDDASLTVLNPSKVKLPRDVNYTLSRTARHYPQYFLEASSGQSVELGDDIRIAAEGVFRQDRRVATLDEIITTYSRADIVEVGVFKQQIARGALKGLVFGAVLALGVYGLLSAAYGGEGDDGSELIAATMVAGGVGAGLGAASGAIPAEEVIYRSVPK